MESSLPLDYSYLACDPEGRTSLIRQPQEVSLHNHSYIRIPTPKPSVNESCPYIDPEFIDHSLKHHISNHPEENLVQKRLSELYSVDSELFPPLKGKLINYHDQIPAFVYEMQLLDVLTFKRLFLNQKITKNGKYQVLVNRDGHFQVETVDDFVPVKKGSIIPIWNMDFKQPWQLIVSKVWAKRSDGYCNIKDKSSFEFIQYFTPCTWRFINIPQKNREFLKAYSKKVGSTCRIFLKTKTDKEVERCGLVPGKYCYELIQFDQFEELGKKEFNLLIRSVVPHQWTGNLSIFDQNFKEVVSRLKSTYQLDSTFLMDQPDFFNIFSSAIVTSAKVDFPSFVTSHRFRVPHLNKAPFFFQINIRTKGYLILTIKQGQENKKAGGMFRIRTAEERRVSFKKINEYEMNDRYLEVKYLLVKINTQEKNNKEDNIKREPSSLKESKGYLKSTNLRYTLFDFDYSRGFNKGECHPMAVEPGFYILRLKIQQSPMKPTFTIQTVSHENFNITPLECHPTVQLDIFKDSLFSICHKVPTQNLKEGVSISFGREFETLGYGFIAVRTKEEMPGTVIVNINPVLLNIEGYQLILDFSSKREEFSVEVKAGESEIFVFKILQTEIKQQTWPPEAFKFYISQK